MEWHRKRAESVVFARDEDDSMGSQVQTSVFLPFENMIRVVVETQIDFFGIEQDPKI